MIQNELARSPTLIVPDRLAGSAAVQRRNWWLHVLEGGTLIGSWGAINANTVGTSLVQHLGGAAWMVALMPMATTIGFSLGPASQEFQVWLDWLVKDGQLAPGQLAPSELYTNELNPFQSEGT